MENKLDTNKKSITKIVRLFALLILSAVSVSVHAQNVTISPRNGSMICALTTGASSVQFGFQIGAFATWRHNQLPLMMTASNDTDLTNDGQLAHHANHFLSGDKCEYYPSDPNATYSNYIAHVWGGSYRHDGYITISLPKGYRFTGYTIHMAHDVRRAVKYGSGITQPFTINSNTQVYMIETDKTFNNNIKRVSLPASSTDVVELSRTGNDMGNILYFKADAPRDGFYGISFRYIELTFTADADASISLLPTHQYTKGASMLEIPFNTGKVDLGQIQQGHYQGATRVSYLYNTVSDMPANMQLYEEESVKDGRGFDGTYGKVAYNKGTGSITTAGDYFRLAPTGTGEQIYYLETPVSALNQDGKDNPVQVRMVGATLHYNTHASNTSFHIVYSDGNNKYYLNSDGGFSMTPTTWDMDVDGHIYNGQNYLAGTSEFISTVQNAKDATKFVVDSQGIRTQGGNYIKYIYYNGDHIGYYTSANRVYDNNYYNRYYNAYPAKQEKIAVPAGVSSPGATIYVYDKEGKNPTEFVVDGEGYVELKDINNDAIKFGVRKGDVALVNFTMKMQSLNPYIDQMTVVLNDTHKGKNLRMTQTFTADDFSVGGGKFNFFLPADCVGDPVNITFEDLYSKYGDETYDGGTNNSRYNFVESQHYKSFGGDNIYNGREEAASSTLESERIANNTNIRTRVGTVGDRPFRFNNADKLATQTGYLEEYPFTRSNYAFQQNPGPGKFIEASFKGDEVDEHGTEKTFYVFTTDETRYNIAPTTATQHRMYAFYEMVVNVECNSYEPIIKFKKIYDKTFYNDGNGGDKTEAFYGVEVTAPAHVTGGQASDVAVFKGISEAIARGGDVPADMSNILYLDMSKLNGVYHGSAIDGYNIESFNALRKKFAKNALVFLPSNSTSRDDNFAYLKKGAVANEFQSANNIILTDKIPFYSPYDIQVDAANYATYSRKITAPKNGKVTSASVIFPFTLEVTGGLHTNPDGSGSFSVNKMVAPNAIMLDENGLTNEYAAYFKPIAEAKTKANVPYMIEVKDAPTDGTMSFVVTQKGSDIVKTSGFDSATYNFTDGQTVSGSVVFDGSRSPYRFNLYGNYSGRKISKSAEHVYYFAGNQFVSSDQLVRPAVLMFPFRGYYKADVAPRGLSSFFVAYGDMPYNPTGITDTNAVADLAVTAGHGVINVESARDQEVTVAGINGVRVARLSMEAGQSATVNVPAGVYVINGKKIIVK